MLEVNSYGSPDAQIPSFPNEERRQRVEWVLDLSDGPTLSTNHRRNLKKATSRGLMIERSSSPTRLSAHFTLIDSSLQRRSDHREVATFGKGQEPLFRALLEEGAGELFQVFLGGVPASSSLVLRSSSGAYYHSAGTSPLGMAAGASVFLVTEAARLLAGDACTSFNLGGASPIESGLARFKSGFGARPVELQAVIARVMPPWQAPFAAAAQRLEDLSRRVR